MGYDSGVEATDAEDIASEIILKDTLANRPAAGVEGRLFTATDYGERTWRDSGTAWEDYHHPLSLHPGRPRTTSLIYYNLPGVNLIGTETFTPTTGLIYYMPVITPVKFEADAARHEVITAGALGTTARFGIYQANYRWQPTTRVHDNTNLATVDVVGIRTWTVSKSSPAEETNPIVLPPGRYLYAYVTDAVGLVLRAVTGAIPGAGLHFNLGAAPMLGQMFTGNPHLPANPFPDPGTTWAPSVSGTPFKYFMFVRQRMTDPLE